MMILKVVCSFAIAIGLAIFALAASRRVAGNGAALGVFMILIGLNGFTSARIAKLEEAVKEMKRNNERSRAVQDTKSGS